MNILKLNLHEKVKSIVDQYKLASDAHSDLHRQAYQRYLEKNATGRYKPLHLWEKLAEEKDKADQELAEYGAKLNAEMVKLIRDAAADAKKALSVSNGSADYAGRVSMALAFLREEGRELTDEICFDLIGEFKHDLQTMNRFHRIVERRIDDCTRLYTPKADCYTDLESGRTVALKSTGFQKTFQYMAHANTVLGAIDGLLEIADRLFTRAKTASNESISLGAHPEGNGVAFGRVPMLGLTELMGEDRILKEAQDIDLMLIAMEEAGDFKDD